MTAAFFDVDASGLSAAGRFAECTASDARDQLDRLTGVAGDVVDGGWGGGAGTAFAGEWWRWHAAAQQVVTALSELGTLLQCTAADYASAETAAGRTVTGAAAP